MLSYFVDLAICAEGGWEGAKAWASQDGEMTIAATWGAERLTLAIATYPPDIDEDFRQVLTVPVGRLTAFAAQLEVFLLLAEDSAEGASQ